MIRIIKYGNNIQNQYLLWTTSYESTEERGAFYSSTSNKIIQLFKSYQGSHFEEVLVSKYRIPFFTWKYTTIVFLQKAEPNSQYSYSLILNTNTKIGINFCEFISTVLNSRKFRNGKPLKLYLKIK